MYTALAEADVLDSSIISIVGKNSGDATNHRKTLGSHRNSVGSRSTTCQRVQDSEVLFPLSTVRNSRELAVVIRDIVQCIQAARWLHRDLSLSNIMLNDIGEGVLIDWDHALKSEPGPVVESSRTGTWQFRSIELRWNPGKLHDSLDDLEACYWIMLYVATHKFDSNTESYVLNTFNERSLTVEDGIAVFTGGNIKHIYLGNTPNRVKFHCQDLDDLMKSLMRHFGT